VTLEVDPAELRVLATQLAAAQKAAEDALSYVNKNGTFDWHQTGAMGALFPGHRHYLAALTGMLRHLGDLTDQSEHAVRQTADNYEHTDHNAAARLDASYPASPRPPVNPDQFDDNQPVAPPTGW
jgi:uncharacterized protein YukE